MSSQKDFRKQHDVEQRRRYPHLSTLDPLLVMIVQLASSALAKVHCGHSFRTLVRDMGLKGPHWIRDGCVSVGGQAECVA